MAPYEFRLPRLFVSADLRASGEIALDSAQANYLSNVLRLREGAHVLVFNGREGEWRATLSTRGRRNRALVVESRTRNQPPPGDLVLAFAPLKHARLDYLVQKAVEMGVSRLSPVMTDHTQATRINLERMRANVVEAAEQCGILALAAVDDPQTLDRWLAALPAERLLVFCDEAVDGTDPYTLLTQAPDGSPSVLIGPEGGFSESERKALASRRPVVRLPLGPRILRADTAAVAALALVQAARGDWR